VRSTTFLFTTLCTSIQFFWSILLSNRASRNGWRRAATSRRPERRARPRVRHVAVPQCAVIRAYRGRPATPGLIAASLGKFPSATWSPRPRRLAARRDAHRSVAVLPLCVRTDRCRSLYRGLKAGVLLRNEGVVTLLVPPGYKTTVLTPHAPRRAPPPSAAALPLAPPRRACLPLAPRAGQTPLAFPTR
jgi:hypothetical protein